MLGHRIGYLNSNFYLESTKEVRKIAYELSKWDGTKLKSIEQRRALELESPFFVDIKDSDANAETKTHRQYQSKDLCDGLISCSINRINIEIEKISIARSGFIATGLNDPNSGIDNHVEFTNLFDIISYIPRALQIAIFSPFPNKWFDSKSAKTSKSIMYLSYIETIVVYISFFGFYFLYMKNCLQLKELFIPILLSLMNLLFLGLVVNNIGTLYRMRFPFVIILAILGVSGYLIAKHKYGKKT
jgi:hypothetical protein